MPAESTARSFRDLLVRVGYDGAAAKAGEHLTDPALQRAAVLATLDPEEPREALQRVFLLGEPGRLPEGAEDAEALGLIRRDGVPLVHIDEVDGLFVCSDVRLDGPEAVPPVSASTRLAAAFTPELEVGAALDVGCGSGAHALRLARHAEHVVATDVSERALELTRLNARLNGLDNVETRHGSFLEPVRGERFGLVVCNPPFVISPDTSFVYRDAGMRGDELSRRLLDELPEVLEDGGFATLQGNWAHPAGASWYPAPPCTALLTRIRTYTPVEYAQSWCAPEHPGDPEGFSAAVTRWTASYAELGIEAITMAIAVMQGGSMRRPWATTMRRTPQGLGRRLPALFAAAERLARTDLLSARLRPVRGLDVERYRRAGGEPRCVLEHPATPCVRRPVTPAVADAVERLPGTVDNPAVWEDMTALVKLGFVEFDER